MKRDYYKINGVECQEYSPSLMPPVNKINSDVIARSYARDKIEHHVIERLSALMPFDKFYVICNSMGKVLEIYCQDLDVHINNVLSLQTDSEKIEYWLSQEYGLVPHYLRNRNWDYITRVPIGEINYGHELRHLNEEIINKYFDINNPILLCDGNNKLLDGYHRLCAAIRAKKKYVNVIKIINP